MPDTDRDHRGYRVDAPAGVGARIRADVIEVHVARARALCDGGGVDALQLLRAKEPLKGSWQPVMGHIEAGETAAAAALRELREEVGLEPARPGCIGVWALEQVNPFYIAALDCVVLSPRFVAIVDSSWSPTLNAEHSDWRWSNASAQASASAFVWPGQHAALREVEALAAGRSLAMPFTRIV